MASLRGEIITQSTWRVATLALGLAVCSMPPAGTYSKLGSQCFAVEFGQWSRGDESLDFYRPLPTRVVLTDSVLRSHGADTLFAARRAPRDSLRRVAYWRRGPKDSLQVFFPSWWSTGVRTIVGPTSGGDYVGEAAVYVDYDPFTAPRAPVRLVPHACDGT